MKKIILSIATLSTLVAPVATVIACGSSSTTSVKETTNEDSVLKLIDDYDKGKNDIDQYGGIILTKENSSEYLDHANETLAKVEELETKLGSNQYKNDHGVWLAAFKYRVELEKQGIEVNSRYLGSSPTSGQFKPINGFWSSQLSYASQALNKSMKEGTFNVENTKFVLERSTTVLKALKANMQEGLEKGVTFSGVYTRLLATHIKNYFGDFNSEIDLSHWGGDENNSSIQTQITEYKKAAQEYRNFLFDEYWKGISYGKASDSDHAKPFPGIKDARNEIETIINGIPADNKGYGLTQNDLDAKDVGIGFSGVGGENIYKHIIKFETTTEKTPAELIEDGKKGVQDNKNGMIDVMKYVYNEQKDSNGAWNPTVKIDPDGPGNLGAADVTLNIDMNDNEAPGEAQLQDFLKYLKSEKFAFGRDDYADQFITDNNLGSESGQVNPLTFDWESHFSKEVIDKLDKAELFEGYLGVEGDPAWQKPIAGTSRDDVANKNVSGLHAFIGAASALSSYDIFKDASTEYIKEFFNKVNGESSINPIEYAGISGEGVGSYGSGSYNLNVDPYYAITKWSMSSLSLHEDYPGHHLQSAYFTENKEENAPEFRYTAFAEGWGLFSEWFGVIKGIYGSADIDASKWYTSNSPDFTSPSQGVQFDNDSATLDKPSVSEYQGNGTYKSIGEYNALQYFGYLNELQLRAMRLTLDPSVHSGKAGDFADGTGMSIQEERDYMTSNSALGLGDITSESKRYLQYVGQANSYFTGRTVMQDLYKKYWEANKDENGTITKEEEKVFFGLMLKNNDLPLDVLYNYVESNTNISS